MKHNHTTRRVQKSGMSSYKRSSKREFTYSETYQKWRRALVDGDHTGAREASRAHAIRFLGFDATSPAERRRQDQVHSDRRGRAA